jgi:hypothetical protein
VIYVLATPVLTMVMILLVCEHVFGLSVFDPALGGDPLLFQHLFWFYSHPAVYIMILPGFGIVSEVITTFSRKSIFGYKFIAWSSVSIAVISFFVWATTCSWLEPRFTPASRSRFYRLSSPFRQRSRSSTGSARCTRASSDSTHPCCIYLGLLVFLPAAA